ncbi:prealbumin-like fold domain-containing protein [Bifidobacterium sp. SO4]|uniref:prealbumin-like fold domain-containing protein n=1 Tax=Bifidobacterium sp. SO4 TaxID=2809030 RepID=UPI001BDD74BB|nr:prealbumin-like fold domain-containing protein [Bifidobacterium sp. SO4]MBT1170735.1 hypothetical protein [Bifidobacterium sp. SO4]
MKRNNKPNKRWIKLVGVLTAAALGLTYAGSALADDFTLPGTTSSDSSTGTWADQADGDVSNVPDDGTDSTDGDTDTGNTNADGNVSDDSNDNNTPATPQVVTPIANCDNVQDWSTLAGCVTNGQSGLVTITKTIDVPAGGAVAVSQGNVILTATTGNQPALTATATSGNLDAFFVVNNGATLTVGQDANDGGFSYKNGNRWFAYVNTGGTLTVNNGTFDGNNTTANTNRTQGTLAYINGGSVVINGGTFSNNKAERGGVVYSDTGDIAVHGGEFSGNESTLAGGVFMQKSPTGVMTVDETVGKVKFSNNVSYTSGGAIHSDGTLTISGGEFNGNKTEATNEKGNGDGQGGGAISQDQGSTTITGGTFTGNAQTFTSDVQCTNDKPNPCHRYRSGGGAIRLDGGSLIIVGGVKFTQNYSRTYGWGVGGGAIYVQGKLSIRNDDRGNKPLFDHNWSGIYDHQYMQDAGGNDLTDDNGNKVIPNGGAGGAIFVQDGNSEAFFMGGKFTGNSSGYLGGAVYTEEHSTSYIAKAVAYSNTAGHFGGGLWLCPSGIGEASKGGNIALFDNSVSKGTDPNTENQNPLKGTDQYTKDSDGTEAGADFAIMNPYHKRNSGITKSSFVLMDSWFTDRTESAVTWYHDGSPLRDASGYDDAYQNSVPNQGSNRNLAVSKKGGRYGEVVNSTIDGYVDHAKDLKLGLEGNTSAEYTTTGVALKAVVTGNAAQQASKKSAAKAAAAVEMTGNQARLSGGAFGTNGNVKFSSPYTASWSKVKNNADGSTPTTATKDNQLAGSEWLIETKSATIKVKNGDGTANTTDVTTIGGPFDPNFYPKVCTADQLAAGDWENGYCWKEEIDSNGNVTKRSAIVKDNTSNDADGNVNYAGFDNNPDGGGFDINNLANGKYTVTEYKAPAGYSPSSKKYTFTVGNAQAEWSDGNGDLGVEAVIGNTVLPGVSWGKMDGDHPTEAVKNTTWTVTPIDQNGTPYTVSDCVKQTANGIACEDAGNANAPTNHVLSDHNPDAGVFTLENLPAGRYKLEESKTPDGYWKSSRMTAESYYWFDIEPGATKTAALMYHDGSVKPATNTEVTSKVIINQQPNVLWSKVDVQNVNGNALDGSGWTITGPYADAAGTHVHDAQGNDLTVTAPVADCKSESGATTPCSSGHNTVDTTGKIAKITAYADLDNAAGKLKVSGLARPASSTAGAYTYELKETRAPEGYVLSGLTYTFKIEYEQPAQGTIIQVKAPDGAGSMQVQHGDNDNLNLIPNAKPISQLPLAGGDARSWMLIGGGLALMAALAALATGRVKRREL